MSSHHPSDPYQHPAQFANKLKQDEYEHEELGVSQVNDATPAVPTFLGMPLKYVSLVTLAVQNALLTIIMHHSRVSTAPSQAYSAAAAVLLNELLKGFISLVIAFVRLDRQISQHTPNAPTTSLTISGVTVLSLWNPSQILLRFRRLGREVFSPDCWKLSIPSILYVIQNNLQYVAASNLDAATFQVSYQMKILTTAAFSVMLLRKKLSPVKWFALLLLAVGVGIVQIQSGAGKASSSSSHEMQPMKGFMAVAAACMTSGLAGVYFEMVLKNSQGDLWVRNVQLSLFSLLPALVPIVFQTASTPGEAVVAAGQGTTFVTRLFANFGPWAWATVIVQVLGGLITALVIKYSDNILKGFATSLSIVISFLASVALFDFRITFAFTIGSTVVLAATWLYNQPDSTGKGWKWGRPCSPISRSPTIIDLGSTTLPSSLSRKASFTTIASTSTISYPSSPEERDDPMLEFDKKRHGSSLSLTGLNLFSSRPSPVINDVPSSPPRPPLSPQAHRSSSLSLLPGHPIPQSRTPPPSYHSSPRNSFIIGESSSSSPLQSGQSTPYLQPELR
ncbi:hypothetical protein JAAARDRAFT_151931 [Jaapia argillacea MUCL 33604]|uniref:UDP-galactose transporter n=1 Tax=Jaapia argillacea MUCL 33604 TaxID=933084 RepID=A0A067Q211_9AGAM|nr:hypothetical protein JAAARDRAFT_151931 [Jaapia argillacea MUCL 33604]